MIGGVNIDKTARLKPPFKHGCAEQVLKGAHMQSVGQITPEIWNSVTADGRQPVKSAGAVVHSSVKLAADDFMMLDYQALVRRVSLAIAMLQQFSTGDDV